VSVSCEPVVLGLSFHLSFLCPAEETRFFFPRLHRNETLLAVDGVAFK